MTHEGWKVTYSKYRPATGRWVAERHGVTMCAGQRAHLFKMISEKNKEDFLWRKNSQKPD